MGVDENGNPIFEQRESLTQDTGGGASLPRPPQAPSGGGGIGLGTGGLY